MRIASIIEESIVDGPGVRYVIFVQGCKHKCSGCHNPSTWNTEGGTFMTTKELCNNLKKITHTKRLTVSGGEPMLQCSELAHVLKYAKKLNFEVCVYTGFTYEEIFQDIHKVMCLNYIDVLIDGKYEEDKKSLDLKYKRSSNQRIIDVKESINKDKIVLLNSKAWGD